MPVQCKASKPENCLVYWGTLRHLHVDANQLQTASAWLGGGTESQILMYWLCSVIQKGEIGPVVHLKQ